MTTALEMQVEEFRQRCREAGLSLTHQRELIYRVVIESRDHPSPETIYAKVVQQIPSISLATVYKNVKTFLEAGLLREVSPHHGSLRLEADLREHHHLVCTRCKAIVDLEEADVEPVQLRRDLPPGFRVLRYSVEFQGLCPDCANERTKS